MIIKTYLNLPASRTRRENCLMMCGIIKKSTLYLVELAVNRKLKWKFMFLRSTEVDYYGVLSSYDSSTKLMRWQKGLNAFPYTRVSFSARRGTENEIFYISTRLLCATVPTLRCPSLSKHFRCNHAPTHSPQKLFPTRPFQTFVTSLCNRLLCVLSLTKIDFWNH